MNPWPFWTLKGSNGVFPIANAPRNGKFTHTLAVQGHMHGRIHSSGGSSNIWFPFGPLFVFEHHATAGSSTRTCRSKNEGMTPMNYPRYVFFKVIPFRFIPNTHDKSFPNAPARESVHLIRVVSVRNVEMNRLSFFLGNHEDGTYLGARNHFSFASFAARLWTTSISRSPRNNG